MRLNVKAEGSFWILLALLILTLPLRWVASALIAAGVHELCHLGMLQLLSVKVMGLRIRADGAVLDTGPMTEKEELLCALAGPGGSFALLLFLHIFPRIALCGLVQGLSNLIPLGDRDGARAVRSGIRLLSGKSPCKRMKMRVQ